MREHTRACSGDAMLVRALAAACALALLLASGLAGCERTTVDSTPPVATGAVDATDIPQTVSPTATTPGAAASDGGGAAPGVAVTEAVVVRVIDGDTAVFRLANGRQERVRFIGIDTPESASHVEPYSEKASAYTRRMLPSRGRVWLETDAGLRDRYGRLLAYVWLERPHDSSTAEVRAKMLNARLALAGYAVQMTVPPNVRYANVFRECVAQARSARRGLWAGDGRP